MSEEAEIEAQSYKLILNSLCEHLSAMTDELGGINNSLEIIKALFEESTFTFHEGRCRGIRTSRVDR